ncbi:STAS domain-containing protein [Evansella clarkii]|uniref:STAS domain-containing protein n=1 Tax=Evansella clarkii TaxID=79879 RepID=UPI000B4538AF|nr:STAS domain-containing protein [Evansella clarkii]
MDKEFHYIGKKIVENQEELARRFSKQIEKHADEHFGKNGMPAEEYLQLRGSLIRFCGEVLYKNEDQITKQVEEWAKQTAQLTLEYNVSLSEALRIISLYQPMIWDFFDEELKQSRITPMAVIEISKKINRVCDLVMRILGERHDEHSRLLADEAYTALEELSVPVVPVAKGLAVIPLVGAIDTHRAARIQDVALSEASRMGLEYVVFDISGVPVMDTMVSNELFSIISALKLLGIEAIISGVRPSIAQTVTNLGIDFKNIPTRANLQQALAELGFKKAD